MEQTEPQVQRLGAGPSAQPGQGPARENLQCTEPLVGSPRDLTWPELQVPHCTMEVRSHPASQVAPQSTDSSINVEGRTPWAEGLLFTTPGLSTIVDHTAWARDNHSSGAGL